MLIPLYKIGEGYFVLLGSNGFQRVYCCGFAVWQTIVTIGRLRQKLAPIGLIGWMTQNKRASSTVNISLTSVWQQLYVTFWDFNEKVNTQQQIFHCLIYLKDTPTSHLKAYFVKTWNDELQTRIDNRNWDSQVCPKVYFQVTFSLLSVSVIAA